MTTPTDLTRRPDWLSTAQYPFTLRHVDTPAPVAYIDEGEGPALLFIHAGTWSFVWRDLIAQLSEHFRCVALDFPGFGLSPMVGSEPRLSNQASTLEGFVDAIGIDEGFTLVLHDLGGTVGMGFAARRPQAVSGLVMMNTFAWDPAESGSLERMLRLMSSRLITAFDVTTRAIPRMATTGFGLGRHLSAADKKAWLGGFRDRERLRRFHQLIGDTTRSSELYREIGAAIDGSLSSRPILTIYGQKNDPFGFQKRLHQTFVDHEGVVIEGGHHFPMMDDPSRCATAIRGWHDRKVVGR